MLNAQSAQTFRQSDSWAWVLLGLALGILILLLIVWWQRRREEGAEPIRMPGPLLEPGEQPPVEPVEETAPAPEPDDLKVIEGIGPKIEQLLHEAGILTYAQLAATDVARLREILEQAGPRFRLADPTTWPEQAALAAAGKWEELRALQDTLKGGRR